MASLYCPALPAVAKTMPTICCWHYVLFPSVSSPSSFLLFFSVCLHQPLLQQVQRERARILPDQAQIGAQKRDRAGWDSHELQRPRGTQHCLLRNRIQQGREVLSGQSLVLQWDQLSWGEVAVLRKEKDPIISNRRPKLPLFCIATPATLFIENIK